MNEKASCITINCACCGNGDAGDGNGSAPSGVFKYAQLEATAQAVVKDQKIYFNDKSFGTLELTPNGSVVVPPGIYSMFVNCQINSLGSTGYVTLSFYDLISGKKVGKDCSRISANHSLPTSGSEGYGLIKVDREMELCLNAYVESTPKVVEIYATIMQIAGLPSESIGGQSM